MRARLAILTAVLGLGAFVGSAQAWADPNSISATCTWAGQTQPCDSTFWYPSEVAVVWTATPPPLAGSVQGCELGVVYSFDSDSVNSTSCSATWSGPSTSSQQYTLHVETSSPTATAALSRPPDSNGWYNHPVALTVTGAYSYSGFASCTNPTYSGPSGSNQSISGTCTDNAGKTATASVSINYDATPPTITGATAARKPDAAGYYTHPVKFIFNGTDGLSGIASCQTVTYRGPSSGSVVGGCWDRAGNYTGISVPVRYRRTAPRASVARSGSSFVLRWKRAAKARYYNVQIYRGKKKVLSTWPAHTSLLLRRSWSFAGHRFRLKAGHYRWYVWPGYGSRAAAHYGRVLVSSSFKVTKPV